jgi:hypothetical protein
MDAEALLARNAKLAADPLMRRLRAEFAVREAARAGAWRRAEIARLERAAAEALEVAAPFISVNNQTTWGFAGTGDSGAAAGPPLAVRAVRLGAVDPRMLSLDKVPLGATRPRESTAAQDGAEDGAVPDAHWFCADCQRWYAGDPPQEEEGGWFCDECHGWHAPHVEAEG